MTQKITITILVKNSEKYIEKVLSALNNFEEVLLGDTGSTDRTLEIAARFPNVRVETIPFLGFGKTHNLLVAKASNDWIFSVDSDEIAEEALIQEIEQLQLDASTVYSIPRRNFYRNIWIKSCGWYPDRVFRLYNRKVTHFSEDLVHEAVIIKGLKVQPLKNHLIHYPYSEVRDFLTKMQLYTDLYAQQKAGRKVTLWTAIFHSNYTFFRSYILKKGILQGGVGFEIAMYNAITAFYKYLKLIN